MVIRVGINGFGRIGRIVLRACLNKSDLKLSAINDPAISAEYICYLIKFDSTHGKLKGNISYTDHEIVIDDNHIKVFQEKLPASVPWHSAGVQYVVEASGMFTNQEKASGHLASDGVKRVIVTAPSIDIPMILLGINGDKLCPDTKIISCASSTLYCLAPIIKVLEDSFGVEEGFLTSIHAMTPSLKPLDGLCLRGRHWRDHRSIHQNIIPATTGACKALGKILPQLRDKLSGMAFRVPIVNVSVLDLTVRLRTNTNLEEIVKSIDYASKNSLNNIIKISNEESVSSDFIGETHSCVFDENSSIQLTPNFFKIICWYENEYSYACRVIDTIIVSENQSNEIPVKMTNIRQNMSITKLNIVQQTECIKKDMFAVCGKTKVNSTVVSKTSQESGQEVKEAPLSSLPHPLFIKKPSSATAPTLQTKRDRKRNELCKIWNDISEHAKINVKQNRCSFFQSCIMSQQLTPKVERNAQERLENVKKEFSKMIDITEGLMKKSYTEASTNDKTDFYNLKADDTSKRNKEISRTRDQSTNEECGDYKSCIDTNSNCQSQNDCIGEVACLLCPTDAPHYSDSYINREESNIRNKHELDQEFNRNSENKKMKTLEILSKKLENRNENGECEKQVNKISPNTGFSSRSKYNPKTLCIASEDIALSSNGIQVQYFCNENKIKTTTFVAKEIGPDKTLNVDDSYNSYISPEKIKGDSVETISSVYKEEKSLGIKRSLCEEKSNLKIIEDALRKRNITLIESSYENIICKKDDISSRDIILAHQSLHELKVAPNITVTDSGITSRCVSPENTAGSLSITVYEKKQDIYDKLDSASASNSDNSFQLNERKSQVLQITDLTKSLEDLERLDKICRIIEISDDLSDRLFSALDDEGTELKNKRWSFKDLCVRIKLDEFCDKVFGSTSYDI